MTPIQFHYPYFIVIDKFNAELSPLHWSARLVDSVNTEDGEYLVVERLLAAQDDNRNPDAIRIDFGTFLMVFGQRLYVWNRYADGLEIRQYHLDHEDVQGTMITDFVEIGPLVPGTQPHPNMMSYDHFVTFIRKPDLVTKEDYYEKYVIIHLHGQSVTMIPFDSFNETGGDPLYMWPALAVLDISKGLLHGLGMRMGSFTLSLDVNHLT